MLEWIIQADTALLLLINATLANPPFDILMPVITNGRFWILPSVVAAAIYLRVEKKRAIAGIGLAILTLAITDPVCNRIIKPLFDRDRPCHPIDFVSGARFLIGFKHSPSFPSSHAMNWCAQAALFSRLHPRSAPWWWAIAGTISFSRIYVGVHYPFDVLTGAILGALTGYGVYMTWIKVRERIESRKPDSRKASLQVPPTGK
jgi:undecaprenyl-diphosphatase